MTVPDTITTWYASGFAVSDKTGLGVSQPAEIRGFKEVFLSMNLPYSVIRGEIVTLPIVIFNYMPDCLHVSSPFISFSILLESSSFINAVHLLFS